MMGETETMLKIFLAEDEIVMREGIRNNIAWQEEGFEFVGEASDGEPVSYTHLTLPTTSRG